MLNTTTFVGLDVHARSIKAVALDAMTGEVRSATFGYDAAEVAGWVSSVDPSAKCVYESGVTGFDLQKRLASMGIDCVVGAVSKMIKPPADRKRKNDRNDAEFLARMLSVGNVVEVWVVYCQPHVDKIGVMISTLSAFCVPTAFPTSEICQA